MNIGEAAARSGVTAKMIRHYEAIGLIASAPRTDGNYRRYGETDVGELRFIRRARNLGFSIKEIAALLALWRDRGRASADVKRLAIQKMAELEARIGALEGMRDALGSLARRCEGGDRPACPILDDLAG